MEQAAKRMKMDEKGVEKGKAEKEKEEAEKEMSKYLHDKQIFASHPAKQQLEFPLVCDPSQAPPAMHKHYQGCHDRLKRLLDTAGDKTMRDVPSEVQTCKEFSQAVPAWADEKKSFVLDRDHSQLKGKDSLAQRTQNHGLCYIHAAVMFQHYLVSMNTAVFQGMVDMAKMIKDSFTTEQLEKHIFDDAGGVTATIAYSILEPGTILTAEGPSVWKDRLQKHGPGLVAFFEVHDDFYTNTKNSYSGKPSGNFVGGHAMVMIGHRLSLDGKNFYLLQNWWHKHQFIEVDEEHLKACHAVVYFCETPQTKFPDTLKIDTVRYADNLNLDKPANLPKTL